MAIDNRFTKEVIECLAKFVIRVSKDEKATPAELEALPEVAKILLDIDRHLMI